MRLSAAALTSTGFWKYALPKNTASQPLSKFLIWLKMPLPKSQCRTVHHQVCPLLYAGCGFGRSRHCSAAAAFSASASYHDWIYRALTFLVISCPCALVISVPLSFFGGIGAASRRGILVKGSNYLQALAETEVVVFDKTGTLTKGTFSVAQVEGKGLPAPEVLELAAYAGAYSSHPVSQSVRRAYGREIDDSKIADYQELPGRGVSAKVNGISVSLGNARLMKELNTGYYDGNQPGTVVNLAVNGNFPAGYALPMKSGLIRPKPFRR